MKTLFELILFTEICELSSRETPSAVRAMTECPFNTDVSRMTQALAHRVFPSPEDASQTLAIEIGDLIRGRAAEGRTAVLGLATGSTPIRLYAELAHLHREGLSFANVHTFNLDEYLGLERDHAESYWNFMHFSLFDHIDIPPENIHIPDGTTPEADLNSYCAAYEDAIRKAGGIDLQVLGIGRNGHIGFNEPGSLPDVRTHVTTLNEVTIQDAARAFGGVENVPRRAITMGVRTILDAHRIVLLAFGASKADIIKRALTEEISPDLPATYLGAHTDASFYLDEAAATKLE